MASNVQTEETRLTERIRAVVGGATVAGGPLAEVAATALLVDARLVGGQSPRILAGLSPEDLLDCADAVKAAIEEAGEVFLPCGTHATSPAPGGLEIGEEVWIMEAGLPGLHPQEAVAIDAGGPNLKLLRSRVGALAERSPCSAAGLPSPFFVSGRGGVHLLRFPPFEHAGEVVLQRLADGTSAPRFRSAGPGQIEDFAVSIVEDMTALWTRRAEIGRRAQEVRDAAGRVAAEHPEVDVTNVCIDLSRQRGQPDLNMDVEVQALDERLRRGSVLDDVAGRWKVGENDSYALSPRLLKKFETRDALRALGADGRIEDVALAIADAAPNGRRAVLGRLARQHLTVVGLPISTGTLHCELYWDNGLISWHCVATGRVEGWSGNLLVHDLLVPDTVLTALPGRRLGDVVELPFRGDCAIIAADQDDDFLRLSLATETSLVELSTGRVWR